MYYEPTVVINLLLIAFMIMSLIGLSMLFITIRKYY